MEDKILGLLQEIKYKKGFPPLKHTAIIKGNLASRGLGMSGATITQVVNTYLGDIETVLDEFTEIIIRNAVKLNIRSENEIKDLVSKATELLFKDGYSHIDNEFKGWPDDYRKSATDLVDKGRETISMHLNRKLKLRELDFEKQAPLQVTGGEVTQKEFPFIKDSQLRQILERDYSEIQRAFGSKCWKSVIILSGGAIEAILTDLLLQNSQKAINASMAPQNPDIRRWDLTDLIDVCVELRLVSSGVAKLSHPVREYRNLVHPGNEVRNQLIFGEEEAKIALEVLHIIHRDLSR